MLTVLWFMCGVKVFFELDILKFSAMNNDHSAYGKEKRPYGTPKVPVDN